MWKSNGTSEEGIKNIIAIDYDFAPTLLNSYPLPYVKFNGHCLINNSYSIPKNVIDLYISRYMFKRFKQRFHTK